jgi:histidine triad (HIT) family protein
MALTPEEIEELKDQLRQQVAHLPEQQKQAALSQIANISPQALESMIAQQQSAGKGQWGQSQKGVFRAIVDGEIKSFIIAENKDSIAVLDIKPISKGHTIIIPKKPIVEAKSLPNSSLSLAKRVAKKISKKLRSKSAEIQTEYKFGEMIINIIPVYDKSLNILSPRSDASKEELEKLYDQLKIVKKQRKLKIKINKEEKKEGQVLKLPRRIP